MSRSLSKIKDRPKKSKDLTLKKLLKNEQKKVRFYLLFGGLVLILIGSSLRPAVIEKRDTASPIVVEASFATEPVVLDKALTASVVSDKKKSPVRIVIPALTIDLPVKEARIVNGYWEVFNNEAGFGLGSAYPEDTGNTVIFAHSRDKLFLPLKDAKVGQRIYVFTSDRNFSFEIYEILEVRPDQTQVIGQTTEPILTLYTCSGFADSKRLIVKAKRTP